jgi:hypothetical protein
MDSKTQSTPRFGAQTAQIQAQTKKMFLRSGDAAPSPKYVNNVEFSAVGMDVFMDAGTVPPEAIRDAAASNAQPPTVEFFIDFRFGMSLQSAVLMHQRLTELLQASAKQAALASSPPQDTASAPTTDTGKDAPVKDA